MARGTTSFTRFFGKRTALISLLLFTLSIPATAQAKDHPASLGLGIQYDSGIYYGQDGYATPYPLIDLNWGGLFIKDDHVGWTAFEWENISVALIAARGQYFLDIDEISKESKDLYLGIKNRDRAIEAGFLYTYNAPIGTLSWAYYKDVSNTHGGMHNITRLSRAMGNPARLTFTPSIYVHYFTSAIDDYYYGVDAAENELGRTELRTRAVSPQDLSEEEFNEFRPTFEGANSGHIGVDLWIKKAYTRNLIGVAYLNWEEVLGEVNNSPLVEDRARYTFRLGMEYRF